MISAIKITSLANIGSNLSYNSVLPIVDINGVATTYKASVQNLGNYILNGAGGAYFTRAAQANIALSVANSAQPNITSVGNLTSLVVTGNVTVSGPATFTSNVDIASGNLILDVADFKLYGGTNGYYLQTDGAGSLSWGAGGGGGGNGTPGGANTQVQFNAAGSFGGDSNFTFDSDNNVLAVPNIDTGVVYHLNGVIVENADLSHGATAALILPSNGNTANPIQVTNTYGNVAIAAGNNANTVTWTYTNNGDLNFPSPPGGDWHLGPAEDPEHFSIHSHSDIYISTNVGNVDQNFIFDQTGTFTAPANVNLLGTRINIGPGSEVVPLTSPVLVATNSNNQYIQVALINSDSNGSTDYAAYGADGDETQGWSDLGFTGHDFSDANYTITSPGDGYLFVQGYSDGTGGNLVFATGGTGLGQDIVFATGGFLAGSEIARFSHSNNALELLRANAALQTRPSVPLTIQTPTIGVSGNEAEWDYQVPTLDNARGQWQGTGTAADGITLYTQQSDVNLNVAEFYTDELYSIPYTLPGDLFGAVGDFIYGTKGSDLYIKGGEAISSTRGLGGNVHIVTSNGTETDWVFTTEGNLYAPGNVILSGPEVLVGPGANALGLADSTLVISSTSTAYLQAVINNVSDIGSADWVAQGHHGNDIGGYIDVGFNSSAFNDPEFSMTGPGDGYVFVAGYDPSQVLTVGGGNLILTTGETGTVRDIIFGTGGFTSSNIFGRISDANNALELSRNGSSIKFFEGTELGQIEGANTFGFYNANANTEFLIELGANSAWSFNGNTGSVTFASATTPNDEYTQKTFTGAVETISGVPYARLAAPDVLETFWTASSANVIAATMTIRVQSTNFTEIIDLKMAKETDSANVSYSIGSRLKTNDSVADTYVEVGIDGLDRMTVWANCQTGANTYYNYNVVEFDLSS